MSICHRSNDSLGLSGSVTDSSFVWPLLLVLLLMILLMLSTDVATDATDAVTLYCPASNIIAVADDDVLCCRLHVVDVGLYNYSLVLLLLLLLLMLLMLLLLLMPPMLMQLTVTS